MKVADIAKKNHVTSEQIKSICNELGIPCQNEETDIVEKDLFLIEKKLEVIKAEKTRKTLKMLEEKAEKRAGEKSGKKIKLKRKVHVSKGLIKEKTENKPAEISKERPKPEQKKFEKTDKGQRPAEKKPSTFNKDKRKPDYSRPAHKSHDKVSDKDKDKQQNLKPAKKGDAQGSKSSGGDKESIKEHTKETSRRKLQGKDKDIKKKFKEEKYKEEKFIEKDIIKKKKRTEEPVKKESVAPERIEITENISIGDLAHKLHVKANEVIAKLMKLGVMATINQIIDSETAEILASEYNTEVKVVSLFDETVIKSDEVKNPEDLVVKPPVVTIMGHVDHGKTKLLDTIRKTNVIDQEFGGITQHIGAYGIKINDHKITFLDTPGHAAFTTMRARGASVTDIVVLIVAANDGVMPQTIEAIDHAKDAEVPVIVALNKIDLEDANPQKARQELSNYGLAPEEWGGQTLYAEISAKNNINIDGLLDLILIQAEMLELKANPKIRAKGTVLESRVDRGRGSVPTILVQEGTLKVGDPFVVGVCYGKVRALFDDMGKPIEEAPPSTPVEVLGITGLPSAGDPFQVVESEKYAKQISQKRQELKRVETAKKVKKVTLENLNEMIKEGEIQELKIIIKADVDGSVQALQEELNKLSTSDIRVKVIHGGTGTINESDVMLASASNAIILAYHIRPTSKIADLAEKEQVSIQLFNVIFEATNSIRSAMEGMLRPDYKEEVVGSGEVKETFKISKLGTVAGSIVLKGKIHRNNSVRLIRDGVVIFESKFKSLKRFQDDVSEVTLNQEFGFTLDGFNDVKPGDTFEAYTVVEVAKTLS
ncbi:MAG: translation initiation factor IF-2 [Spirochaetes bacterium]|nr:translation initiation factor IF-2 [Spirochaetota bacterium]